MKRTDRVSSHIFNYLLFFQDDDLIAGYGDEIRAVFRDDLERAQQEGVSEVLRVWSGALVETIVLLAPRWFARTQLVFAATAIASVLTISVTLGFCSFSSLPVVRACSKVQSVGQGATVPNYEGGRVELPSRLHMFLECSGAVSARPTVILATGRGLGTADSWGQVQRKVDPSIRVCSFDAIGVGESDRIQGNPQQRPIDQVVEDMHALFQAAQLIQPYVLVGASDGALLTRRYQERYAKEIAGLVFVDSSHEEMEWRDAAVAPQLDPNWNNLVFLRNNGFLQDHQKLAWRTNIPLVVLERSEKAPPSAFPGLNQGQVDSINALWHDFQVDLSKRSSYGELRVVPNSTHFMHRDQPGAIVDAIGDVVRKVRTSSLDSSVKSS